MASISDLMNALQQATGWKSLAKPDENTVWHVSLEDNLDANFFALGDAFCVISGAVTDIPEQEGDAEALYTQVARMQIAVFRERPSILTIDNGKSPQSPGSSATILCYRALPLNLSKENFIREVQDWLDDLSWWKGALLSPNSANNPMSSFFDSSVFQGLKL